MANLTTNVLDFSYWRRPPICGSLCKLRNDRGSHFCKIRTPCRLFTSIRLFTTSIVKTTIIRRYFTDGFPSRVLLNTVHYTTPHDKPATAQRSVCKANFRVFTVQYRLVTILCIERNFIVFSCLTDTLCL